MWLLVVGELALYCSVAPNSGELSLYCSVAPSIVGELALYCSVAPYSGELALYCCVAPYSGRNEPSIFYFSVARFYIMGKLAIH